MTIETVPLPVSVDTDSELVPNSSGRGVRFVKAWQVHLGPFAGYDRNRAQAKRNIVAGIEKFADEYQRPDFIEFGGLVGVVWCQPHDIGGVVWWTKVIGPTGGYTGTSSTATRADAVSSVRWHLADGYAMTDFWDAERVDLAADFLDAGRPDEHGHTGHDLRRYCAWQRAYQHGDAQHVADVHRWATEHQNEYLDRFDKPGTIAA